MSCQNGKKPQKKILFMFGKSDLSVPALLISHGILITHIDTWEAISPEIHNRLYTLHHIHIQFHRRPLTVKIMEI